MQNRKERLFTTYNKKQGVNKANTADAFYLLVFSLARPTTTGIVYRWLNTIWIDNLYLSMTYAWRQQLVPPFRDSFPSLFLPSPRGNQVALGDTRVINASALLRVVMRDEVYTNHCVWIIGRRAKERI